MLGRRGVHRRADGRSCHEDAHRAYRMFTSRAEHRLLLRADNSADRLTPIADTLGLLGTELGRCLAHAERQRHSRRWNAEIDARTVNGEPLAKAVKRPEFGEDELRSSVEGRTTTRSSRP